MLEKLFYNHGFFCASHPWEVIVFTLTFTLSILFMGNQLNSNTVCVINKNCNTSDSDKNTYVILMTIIRCMAVLYIYHQFRNLRKLGSKHILGIVGLFTVFSSFVFSSSVMNFLQRDFAALNEALPFFLLLNDLSKASLLAQFALTSSNQKEVRDNIARGMSLRGPNITLDTVVGTLVIGVGSLSGVKHLDVMCCFACLSVIVNYLVFMTFFPACLSLVLELSGDMNDQNPVWQVTSFARSLHEDEQKPNLILQRVKLIMSAGLFLVHAHSRWPITTELYTGPEVNTDENKTVNINEESMLARWFRVNPDQVVIFILAVFLTIKYIFFESHNSEEIIVPVFSEHQIETASTNVACSSVSMISNREKKINLDTKFTQTVNESNELVGRSLSPSEPRSIPKCLQILKSEGGVALSDDEIIRLLSLKHISSYQLEKVVEDTSRAVYLRRRLLYSRLENESALQNVPYINYDYCGVTGVCCENVIGYVPIPLGVAGPLLMNGKTYFIPMATTEGCLVASTNRGCRALMLSGGVQCSVLKDFMTRGPVVRFGSAKRLVEAKQWLEQNENFIQIKSSFDSTSRFARLQRLKTAVAGLLLFIRFEASTGDAMGMNMLTKGTEKALKNLKDVFPDMEVISLSGNYCTDKKPTAINWIEGRGKEVACYATIPEHVVRDVLKTSISALIDVNTNKNLIGSAMAGALGGYNAQAANIVAAIFIATGQDPAQTVTSSNCMTLISLSRSEEDSLDVSVNMPSLEVGTIGGGTTLSPQAACLDMLGVKGSCDTNPGQNASTLACVIGATVLAGELSLLAALSAGHLVNSHMTHNRPSKSQ